MEGGACPDPESHSEPAEVASEVTSSEPNPVVQVASEVTSSEPNPVSRVDKPECNTLQPPETHKDGTDSDHAKKISTDDNPEPEVKPDSQIELKQKTHTSKPVPPRPLSGGSSVQAPVIPYKEPSWGSQPPLNVYAVEVIKNGCVKSRIELGKKSYIVFGRLSSCDVVIDHPSSSRYHAILQYKGVSDDKSPCGYYIWDLASTHGTFVNKTKVKPSSYIRVHTGYVLKFGGSTRLYILQGPNVDQEEEGVMPIKKTKKKKSNEDSDASSNETDSSSDGITWGIGEDAKEEEIDLETILKRKKPLELKDPKKTLRGFFEREGLDLEYGVEEEGRENQKVYITRVSLPIDTATGEEVVAEGRASNKKQSVLMCATDGCRILDAYDMLRSVQYESENAKLVKKLADNDFYDSDEDSFTDRTGEVERKRLLRIARYKKTQAKTAETFESLNEKLTEMDRRLHDLRTMLANSEHAEKEEGGGDSLDTFMSSLDARIDKKVKMETKRRITQLEKERVETLRLIEITRPANLPPLLPSSAKVEQTSSCDDVSSALITSQQQSDMDNDAVVDTQAENTSSAEDSNENRLTAEEAPSMNDHPESSDTARNVQSKSDRTSTETQDKQPSINKSPGEKQEQQPSPNKPPESGEFKIPTGFPVSDSKKRKSTRSPTIGSLDAAESPGEKSNSAKKKKKKKRVLGPALPWKSGSDSNYADWTPPEGQTGDGKTSLNEKFGY